MIRPSHNQGMLPEKTAVFPPVSRFSLNENKIPPVDFSVYRFLVFYQIACRIPFAFAW